MKFGKKIVSVNIAEGCREHLHSAQAAAARHLGSVVERKVT